MPAFPLPRALALTLTLSALLAACTPPGGGQTVARNNLDQAPPKSSALAVRTVTARAGSLSAERTASASIRAVRDSRVAAQTGGTVQAVLAQQGERVGQGAVVVQLDQTAARQALDSARLQLRQAQVSLAQTRDTTAGQAAALGASVTSAEAALAQAQAQARATEQLYGVGGASLTQVQSARSALAQAQSALAQARNTLAQNGRSASGSVPLNQAQVDSAAAAVAQAEQNLARTAVRAPFAGTVASLDVEVGEFAAQGSPVFRLVDPGSLRAEFNVPPEDAAALGEGAALNLDAGGQTLLARVVGSPGIAGTSRLVPITARIEGGGGAALPVGASVQVRYRARLGQGVLVPASAVQSDPEGAGGTALYVVRGGVARRVAVSVVAESGGQLAVRGLEAGARVVSPLPAALQDGARVQVAGGGA